MDFRSLVILLPLRYTNTSVMFVILKHNIVFRPILVVGHQTKFHMYSRNGYMKI